jgi:hypothetical protein
MATKSDHQIIRDYITAMDHMQYAFLPEGVVCINMTHSNLPPNHPDVSYSYVPMLSSAHYLSCSSCGSICT